jgi:hypothetical protein
LRCNSGEIWPIPTLASLQFTTLFSKARKSYPENQQPVSIPVHGYIFHSWVG